MIITRAGHNISRKSINNNALKVLYKLKDAGYQTFLVGGCVRDLLLGHTPKDFDIATNAHPEQVRKIFSNCRLIGRRFRLAHVHFGRDIIEVATFRGATDDTAEDQQQSQHGMILRDNLYGTIEEDIWRRDFSVNALYYNIADFSIVDYCGGMKDLAEKQMRLIGDPQQRYREDPVRILRAIRFAAKLGFEIHPETAAAIKQCKDLLQHVSSARLFDEVLKLLLGGSALATFVLLQKFEILELLFRQTAGRLKEPEQEVMKALINQALINTDARLKIGKSINPAFLLSALLWYPMQKLFTAYLADDNSHIIAWENAVNETLMIQIQQLAIPRRFTLMIREIWTLQSRLLQRTPKKAYRTVQQPRFRAAYDLLLLRAEAGEQTLTEVGLWWTEFQIADAAGQDALLNQLVKPTKTPGKRKRKKKPSIEI